MVGMLVLFLFVQACVIPVFGGYGDSFIIGGVQRPTYSERTAHFYLNAARIDPTQYKIKFMANFNTTSILGATSFPAVAPIYLSQALANSSYVHSYDMSTCTSFFLNTSGSCDGTMFTNRIAQFYCTPTPYTYKLLEGWLPDPNVTHMFTNSTRWTDPLDVTNSLLCGIDHGTACNPDGTHDGQRANIMNSNMKEVGVGAVTSATRWNTWTLDFGIGASGTTPAGCVNLPVPTTPVYAGSHRIIGGNIQFMAIASSGTSTLPVSPAVAVGNQFKILNRDFGSALGSGAYFFNQTAGAGCRSYFFQFTVDGQSYRYPATGCLVTYGEGGCLNTYDAACTGNTNPTPLPYFAVATSTYQNGVNCSWSCSSPIPGPNGDLCLGAYLHPGSWSDYERSPAIINTYTNLVFTIACNRTTPYSIGIYFYSYPISTRYCTTSWATYSIPMTALGNGGVAPSPILDDVSSALNFVNQGSLFIKLYMANISFTN